MDKGAHFYNCDFQVHTPRDNQWHGLEAVTEEERKQYAKEFVKELNSKPRNDHKYFQVVSDDFKKYLDDENKRVKYRYIGKRIVGDQIYYSMSNNIDDLKEELLDKLGFDKNEKIRIVEGYENHYFCYLERSSQALRKILGDSYLGTIEVLY